MTRKKVKLALISNESARKATFKKRKKGLMKKVHELSTLCGIESCAIVYSPYEAQPDVWPDLRGAHRVLSHFKRMPEMEQCKKMVNQESFLRHRISKAAELLHKLRRENRLKDLTHLMYLSLSGKPLHPHLLLPDLNDLLCLIDHNLQDIHNRIQALRKAAPPAEPEPAEPEELVVQKPPPPQPPQQWFADWGMGNPSEHQCGSGGGGGGGDEMIVPFSDGSNNHAAAAAMWSNVYFP